jgi:hypothetical protein
MPVFARMKGTRSLLPGSLLLLLLVLCFAAVVQAAPPLIHPDPAAGPAETGSDLSLAATVMGPAGAGDLVGPRLAACAPGAFPAAEGDLVLSPAYAVEPAGRAIVAGSVLTLEYGEYGGIALAPADGSCQATGDPDDIDLSSITIVHWTEDGWVTLPTQVDPEAKRAQATLTETGTYRVVSRSGAGSTLPSDRFLLRGAAPNPVNPWTTVSFDLPRQVEVELTIYDARGRRVKRLVSGTLPAGPHQAAWQGRDESGRPVAPGVYFVRMTAEAFSGVRKMLLIR